jgi:hypothetical protein
MDILRKRGNNYIAHFEAGMPPVLTFDYEIVLDGRTFERPVNYAWRPSWTAARHRNPASTRRKSEG